METTLQSPSIESFSYSWLANLKPSSFDESYDQDEASFIEMDPRLPPSKRFIKVSSDFGFDFPVQDSPLGLVHADELISNGFLVPLVSKDMKNEDDYYTTSNVSSSCSIQKPIRRVRCASLRRCQRLSKRFFEKYLKFFLRTLFCRRGRGCKFESCNNGRMMMSTRNWDMSDGTSTPRTSLGYSGDDNWRRSCDSESSIYEAVLHCKRTQGI